MMWSYQHQKTSDNMFLVAPGEHKDAYYAIWNSWDFVLPLLLLSIIIAIIMMIIRIFLFFFFFYLINVNESRRLATQINRICQIWVKEAV